jgi:hypothetical protein
MAGGRPESTARVDGYGPLRVPGRAPNAGRASMYRTGSSEHAVDLLSCLPLHDDVQEDGDAGERRDRFLEELELFRLSSPVRFDRSVTFPPDQVRLATILSKSLI